VLFIGCLKPPKICSDHFGNGWGRILACMKLSKVQDNKVVIGKELYVFNSHLGLGESEKDKSVELLPELMKNIAGENAAILCMDSNFFYDKDGYKHEKKLFSNPNYQLENWTCECERTPIDWEDQNVFNEKYSATSDNQFKEDVLLDSKPFGIVKTFVPYSYEKEYDAILNMPCNMLDKICVHGLQKTSKTFVDTRTFLEKEPKWLSMKNSTPSDHLPVITEFSF
jgi:hypothetical protein